MAIMNVDIRVQLDCEDEDLEDYESLMDYARENRNDIASYVRQDNFEILQVVQE